MRRLFLEIVLLVAFVAGVFGLLEWKYRDYSIGLDRQLEQFREERSHAQWLFLGNSHIIPLKAAADSLAHVPSASLALVGMDLFWTRVLLEREQDSLPAVVRVILNADPEILGYNQTLHGQAWINRALFRYGDTLYNDLLSERWMARSNFFRSNRNLSWLFRRHESGAEQPLVRDRLVLPLDDTLACKARALENSRTRFDERLFGENLEHLIHILDCCRRHGWETVLVRTPKRQVFLRHFEHPGIGRAKALIDSVAAARSLTVFEPRWPGSDDRFIADPDHLTIDGARRFITQLEAALKDQSVDTGSGRPAPMSFSMITGK